MKVLKLKEAVGAIEVGEVFKCRSSMFVMRREEGALQQHKERRALLHIKVWDVLPRVIKPPANHIRQERTIFQPKTNVQSSRFSIINNINHSSFFWREEKRGQTGIPDIAVIDFKCVSHLARYKCEFL